MFKVFFSNDKKMSMHFSLFVCQEIVSFMWKKLVLYVLKNLKRGVSNVNQKIILKDKFN